jgi:hypothetical protein
VECLCAVFFLSYHYLVLVSNDGLFNEASVLSSLLYSGRADKNGYYFFHNNQLELNI